MRAAGSVVYLEGMLTEKPQRVNEHLDRSDPAAADSLQLRFHGEVLQEGSTHRSFQAQINAQINAIAQSELKSGEGRR